MKTPDGTLTPKIANAEPKLAEKLGLSHIAIIMDGNGRWAQRRGRPRVYGHIRGCWRVRDIIFEAQKLGVKALTLYAFSSENWGRPDEEVGVLMRLLYKWLMRERKELMERNIRFQAIGAVDRLPPTVRDTVRETERLSKQNTSLCLTLALSYGSRDEMVSVIRKLAREAVDGNLDPEQISDRDVEEALSTRSIGDPDLLIRTSGEQRLSNFLLWQVAYSELYFTDTMWPDFKEADLRRAIDSYGRRQRRFGLTGGQVVDEHHEKAELKIDEVHP
jgi:undecaprenyl diphosphate synthase